MLGSHLADIAIGVEDLGGDPLVAARNRPAIPGSPFAGPSGIDLRGPALLFEADPDPNQPPFWRRRGTFQDS